jgi:hypothetical protein
MLGRVSAPALDSVGAAKTDTSRARRNKATKGTSFLKVNGRFLEISMVSNSFLLIVFENILEG